MIADAIDSYLRNDGKDVPDALLDVAAAHVRRSLSKNFGAKREHRVRVPSPSSKWYCARRQLFDALPMAAHREDDTPRSRVIFTLGDSVEAVGMLLARQAGVQFLTPDVGGEQLRLSSLIVPADFGYDSKEPFPIAGNIDCTISVNDHGECVADWKSMSDYGYDDAEEAARNPNAKWWTEARDDIIAQVRWYMLMLRLAGRGDGKMGYIIGVKKSTGHVCEVVIPHDEQHERELVAKAAYVWRHLRTLAMVQTGVGLDDVRAFTASLDGVNPESALAYILANVPRPKWAVSVTLPGRNARADGTFGPVEQIDTARDSKRHGSGPFVGFRCGYCPFVGACWPGFSLVALGKPVWRRAVDAPASA